MQGDVFGAKGDFITSPEVCQVFGEVCVCVCAWLRALTLAVLKQLIAVWVLSDWLSHGKTTPLQLVEMGPGRGSLLQDVMRVSVKWVCPVTLRHSVSAGVPAGEASLHPRWTLFAPGGG